MALYERTEYVESDDGRYYEPTEYEPAESIDIEYSTEREEPKKKSFLSRVGSFAKRQGETIGKQISEYKKEKAEARRLARTGATYVKRKYTPTGEIIEEVQETKYARPNEGKIADRSLAKSLSALSKSLKSRDKAQHKQRFQSAVKEQLAVYPTHGEGMRMMAGALQPVAASESGFVRMSRIQSDIPTNLRIMSGSAYGSGLSTAEKIAIFTGTSPRYGVFTPKPRVVPVGQIARPLVHPPVRQTAKPVIAYTKGALNKKVSYRRGPYMSKHKREKIYRQQIYAAHVARQSQSDKIKRLIGMRR